MSGGVECEQNSTVFLLHVVSHLLGRFSQQ
jgi:hypothetical protein